MPRVRRRILRFAEKRYTASRVQSQVRVRHSRQKEESRNSSRTRHEGMPGAGNLLRSFTRRDARSLVARACSYKAMRRKIVKQCPICEEMFETSPYKDKATSRRFVPDITVRRQSELAKGLSEEMRAVRRPV